MAVKTYPANYNYGTGAAPYYATPHTAGIDSLPKAGGFIEHPGYEKALRRMSQRLARQMLSNQYDQKAKAAATKAPTRGELKKAAAAGKTLEVTRDSDCFASLEWTDGIATAEFYRGGQIVYDYPMSLDEFLEWAQADEGLGEFFNASIRE